MRGVLAKLAVLLLAFATAAAASEPAARSGDAHANDGNFPAAVKAFAAAHAAQPEDAEIAARLARAELRAGRAKQALESIARAVELAPGTARYRLLLGDVNSNYVNEVGMLKKLGIAHAIRDAYIKAVELEPDNAQAHLSLAMYYLIAPGVAGGSTSKGEAELAALARIDPAEAELVRARMALRDKNPEVARAAFTRAAALRQDGSGEVAEGMFELGQKEPDAALAAFRRALAKDPRNAKAWYQIGRLAAEGETDAHEGIEALTTYLALPIDWIAGDAPRSWAHYRLGLIHRRAGDDAAARTEFARALELDPDFKEARAAL